MRVPTGETLEYCVLSPVKPLSFYQSAFVIENLIAVIEFTVISRLTKLVSSKRYQHFSSLILFPTAGKRSPLSRSTPLYL